MRVTLPEQLADLVKRKLDSGLYASSEEVIAAANRLELAMVFTGTRHFRH